ncbi:MAG: STAS domain-containing protein [Phycisphaerales bacterium]|nr:STAS domain-containing protein [Phycisphaerales bacterium]
MQSPATKFELTEYAPGCLLMRCSGGLSWEDRNQLAECVERRIAADTSCRGLIVDLETVEFINSAGLGALFQLAQRLRSQGRRLILARAQATFTRLFQLAGLTRLARTADSFDDAARAMAQNDDVEITMETESNGVVRR